AIAAYFRRFMEAGDDARQDAAASPDWPDTVQLELSRVQSLRYGENPDQAACFYGEAQPPAGSLPHLRQLHGKELSFNNLLDVEAAASAVSAFAESGPACVIVKHTTPCGVAVGATLVDAYRKALAGDPVSAFGGIVAVNGA